MKFFIYSFIFVLSFVTNLKATTADELMQVHKVTTIEMNAINLPQTGSIVFNTAENTLFYYTGSIWKRLKSLGSETKVNAGNGIAVTGNGTAVAPYSIEVN